jgi:hypothetical protein
MLKPLIKKFEFLDIYKIMEIQLILLETKPPEEKSRRSKELLISFLFYLLFFKSSFNLNI